MVRILLTSSCAALLAAVGCSGGAATAPSSAGATITGTVVRAEAAPSAMTVSVTGTGLSSPVDAAGAFRLGGVPTGDVQLVFDASGARPTLTLPNVAAREVIELQVAIAGNTATVQREKRGNGAGNNAGSSAVTNATLDIRKLTNGEHVSQAPGPSIPVGSAVAWTYVITNRSAFTFTSLTVSDDRGVAVTCPRILPAPGQSVTCTGSGVAVAGQYRNVGTAVATANGNTYTNSDASFYFGGDDDDEGESSAKVQLCHRTGNGSYHLIEVSVNAEKAHRGHGDAKVGEAVPDSPGRVFTASCTLR